MNSKSWPLDMAFLKAFYLLQYFSTSIYVICFYVKIVSFADNTSNISANNTTNLAEDLENSARSIFKWFANNQIQVNSTKCHTLLSTN